MANKLYVLVKDHREAIALAIGTVAALVSILQALVSEKYKSSAGFGAIALSGAIAAWIFYQQRRKREKRHRIAILLPLTSDKPYVHQDVELILEGFGNALPKLRSHIDRRDIQFYDHHDQLREAEKIVKQALDEGVEYFVVTMSRVCDGLSKSFPKIVAQKKNRKAVLICTVAASPDIECKQGMVYRFFVNAHNEADHLVENLPIDFKKAAMIRFVTPYGQFVTDRFREKWANSGAGRECADPVILKEEEWPKIQREIGLPSNLTKLQGKDIILVVAYCTAYQDILLALKNNGITATIVTTSTFSFKKMDDAKKIMLANFSWVSCIPKMRDEAFYGDVANYRRNINRLGLGSATTFNRDSTSMDGGCQSRTPR